MCCWVYSVSTSLDWVLIPFHLFLFLSFRICLLYLQHHHLLPLDTYFSVCACVQARLKLGLKAKKMLFEFEVSIFFFPFLLYSFAVPCLRWSVEREETDSVMRISSALLLGNYVHITVFWLLVLLPVDDLCRIYFMHCFYTEVRKEL